MTFVAPPPPVDPAVAAQTVARGPTVVPQPAPQPVAVVELPQALQAIERAVLLPGTVIDQQTSAQGVLAQVRTSLGDVLLQVTTPLPVGRPVVLQIPAGNPPQTALVDTSASGTGQAGTPAVPATPAALTPAVVANIGAPAAPLLPGAVIEVLQLPTAATPTTQPATTVPGQTATTAPTVAATTTAAATTAATTPTTAASTTVATTPATVAAATTQVTAALANATPVTTSPSLRGAGAALFAQTVATEVNAPTAAAPNIALTPSQTPAPLGVRVLQVLPPGSQIPPTSGDQIAATVGSARASGFPVATTPDGQAIALQTNARVDPGSVVVLQRLPTPVGANGEAPVLPLDPIRGDNWPALAAALRTLDVADPAAAQAMRAAIPQPNANLAPAMLFVAAALKLGDPRALFGGSAIDALKRSGKGNVTERLFEDFNAASERASDVVGAEWRSYPIPMQENDGRIAMMQLHVLRRDDQQRVGDREADARDEGEGKRTRFLLDIAPSALGPIQLDGLVRPSPVSPVVDLVVRSKTPLPDEMRRDIAGIWADALSLTGAKGALAFQANPQSFVDTTGFRSFGKGKGVGLSA
ncbi:hypothetical protein [Roseiterribacter gracilis]|uniref:Uncharacterized protein n=1 Tax=Roseiterribacter gracilis TaxID=2812848 RepID=A0A8S8XKU1_9PROT|nr:hypothetical protein TMPK1_36770 [Rhodospirillales bacterium TMPK1]